MITPENYLSQIAALDLSVLPDTLQKSHAFVMKATAEGTQWDTYRNSAAIKKTVDLYFRALSEYVTNANKVPARKQAKGPKESSEDNQSTPKPPSKRKTKEVVQEAFHQLPAKSDC